MTLLEKIPTILDELGIKYQEKQNRLVFPCPIHEGDNTNGCCIFTDEKYGIGNWICWTQHCEEEYGKSVYGFIKGLSQNYPEVRKYLRYVPKVENTVDPEKKKFINLVSQFSPPETQQRLPLSSLNRLQIPASYYLKRGYSYQTLKKYNVGFCNTPGVQMFARIVVPVLSDDGMYILGCLGRSQNPKCEKCKKYHMAERPCPSTPIETYWAEKWINSKGFVRKHNLYNFWNAKYTIDRTNTAILVEGPGDVWRLEEAGIHNALAIFGTQFTLQQLDKLNGLRLSNVVILTDSDEAGKQANQNITKILKRYYNLYSIELSKKDVGDMSIDEVQTQILPLINEIQ